MRDAAPSEMPQLAALLASWFTEYRTVLPPGIWSAYRVEIGNLPERRAISELIVASSRARIVGTVTFFPDATLDVHGWPQGGSSLRLLAVDPAFRGLGIGRSLIEECVRRARLRKARFLGLHTAEVMAAGIRLYERMGFARAPEFDFDPHAHYKGEQLTVEGGGPSQTVRGLAYVLGL